MAEERWDRSSSNHCGGDCHLSHTSLESRARGLIDFCWGDAAMVGLVRPWAAFPRNYVDSNVRCGCLVDSGRRFG